MSIGVTQEELEMLRQYLEKNLNNIRSPEDFVQGLTHALTMIAYGYPEMINPTPGDGFILSLGEWRKNYEAQFPEFESELTIRYLLEHIEQMGAPKDVIQGLRKYLEKAGDYDELFSQLREGYNDIAERYMNMENGGGDREMPNMENFGEIMQGIAGEISPIFIANMNTLVEEHQGLFDQMKG